MDTKATNIDVVNTVKPVYNDHPRDPKIVAVVDRWSLFRAHLCNKISKWDPKKVVFEGRLSQFEGVSSGLTVFWNRNFCEQTNKHSPFPLTSTMLASKGWPVSNKFVEIYFHVSTVNFNFMPPVTEKLELFWEHMP